MHRNAAMDRARAALAELESADSPLQLVAADELVDVGWAWVCPWSTARWFVTKDPRDAQPPGFGPVVVVKPTGETWLLGSGVPFDDQLAGYADEHGFEHRARPG